MKPDEMPLGFSMALARNHDAMRRFATLDEARRLEIIAGTHGVKSKEEMQQYVDSIVPNRDDAKEE